MGRERAPLPGSDVRLCSRAYGFTIRDPENRHRHRIYPSARSATTGCEDTSRFKHLITLKTMTLNRFDWCCYASVFAKNLSLLSSTALNHLGAVVADRTESPLLGASLPRGASLPGAFRRKLGTARWPRGAAVAFTERAPLAQSLPHRGVVPARLLGGAYRLILIHLSSSWFISLATSRKCGGARARARGVRGQPSNRGGPAAAAAAAAA